MNGVILLGLFFVSLFAMVISTAANNLRAFVVSLAVWLISALVIVFLLTLPDPLLAKVIEPGSVGGSVILRKQLYPKASYQIVMPGEEYSCTPVEAKFKQTVPGVFLGNEPYKLYVIAGRKELIRDNSDTIEGYYNGSVQLVTFGEYNFLTLKCPVLVPIR